MNEWMNDNLQRENIQNQVPNCSSERNIKAFNLMNYLLQSRAGPSLRRVRQLHKAPKSQNFRKEPGSRGVSNELQK